MPTETKTEKTDKPTEFIPRRLKLITKSARGMYLADADTGEDLRLPILSMQVEAYGPQANVHCSFIVVGVEMEKR